MLKPTLYAIVPIVFVALLPASVSAASVYNSDAEPHKIQIQLKDGRPYYVTVYSGSSHLLDCSYGCQIKVLQTGYIRTLSSDETVLIDDGKLRVRLPARVVASA